MFPAGSANLRGWTRKEGNNSDDDEKMCNLHGEKIRNGESKLEIAQFSSGKNKKKCRHKAFIQLVMAAAIRFEPQLK